MPPDWCSIERRVLVHDADSPAPSGNCTFTGCHTGAAREAAGLSLDPGSWRNLVCAPSSTEDGAGRCRVVPRDLDASYLWSRLTGVDLGECGRCSLMPWPRGGLCHEKYAAIRDWILAGAPGDDGIPAPDCGPDCSLDADFDPGDSCPSPSGDAGVADAGPDAAF